MKIYFLVDQPDLGEKESEFVAELTEWVQANEEHASLLNDDNNELGFDLLIKSAKNLIAPLKMLYTMAKHYKCDFVVGFYEQDDREDVCFFGHEEGRVDAFEVASYLGLEK